MSEKKISLRPKNEDKDNGKDASKQCHFYTDNVCRREPIADRNCVKCLSNRYTALYSLNWDRQKELNNRIAELESENQELKILRETELDVKANMVQEAMAYKKERDELRKQLAFNRLIDSKASDVVACDKANQGKCYVVRKLQKRVEELETENRRLKASILMNNDHYHNVDQESKTLKTQLADKDKQLIDLSTRLTTIKYGNALKKLANPDYKTVEKEIEEFFSAEIEKNKGLEAELKLKDKMIELMAFGLNNYRRICKAEDITTSKVIQEYKTQAQQEIGAENE